MDTNVVTDPKVLDAIQAKELAFDRLALLDAADPESGLDAGERSWCRGEAEGLLPDLIDARTRLAVGRLQSTAPEVVVAPVVPEGGDRLYSTDEAAELLGVTGPTVRGWAREGRLQAGWSTVAGGRRSQWRISPRSLRVAVERGVPEPGTYNNPEGPDDQGRGYLETLRD